MEFALASSAREARVCLRGGPFDAFVVDLCLPDGDGIELVRELRSGETIPAILITGHEGPRLKADALRAGIDEVLLKPVDGVRLRAMLHVLHAHATASRARE
jgi:DNA-binding response OmpR family regulator